MNTNNTIIKNNILTMLLLYIGSFAHGQLNNQFDYAALRALYIATDGDSWNTNTGWPDLATFTANPTIPSGTDMDTWHGINGSNNRVTTLELNNNNLVGTLPSDLSNLSNLTNLNVQNNSISGMIPTSFQGLFNLEYLYLNNNQLNGMIPTALGDLGGLMHLHLHSNQLTGSIPKNFRYLSSLTQFTVHTNMLSGCYDPILKLPPSVLCNFSNVDISDGNGFIADWAGFCANNTGSCCPNANLWTGSGGDDAWENATNWSQGHIPLTTENAIIGGSIVSISSNAVAATLKLEGSLFSINGNATLTLNQSNSDVCQDLEAASDIRFIEALQIDGDLIINNAKSDGIYLYQASIDISNTGSISINNHAATELGYAIHLPEYAGTSLNGDINITANINNANAKGIYNGSFFKNNGTIASNLQGTETMIIGTNGQFRGTGQTTGDFINNAIVSPGNSPGITSVTGDYTQSSTGTYKAEIAGNGGAGVATGHDQVAITGDLSLAGTLEISFLGGFTPGASDTYTLMTYTGTRIGTFATVTGLPAGWIVSYDTPGQVRIGLEAVLPVELITFEASLKGRTTVLNWTTTTEINNDYFEVMHSIDGRNWTSIGTVDGHGNTSSIQQYSFLHTNLISGKHYYQLKQVDYDGSSSYSTIVNVRLNTIESVLYPNPVIDLVNIDLPTGTSCDYVVIYNSLGKIVLHSRFERRLDVRHLPQGIYYLVARNKGIPQLKERFIRK